MAEGVKKIIIKDKEDKKIKIRLEEQDHDTLLVGIEGETTKVDLAEIPSGFESTRSKDEDEELFIDEDSNELRAPIPGVVASVEVKAGEEVQKGQVLIALLAMKMENEICSFWDGTIAKIHVEEGQAVQSDELLITFKA